MSSLTNFLLSIYVVRTLGAAQFGAFSLAYVTYGLAINASRGLSIEPLLIRFGATCRPGGAPPRVARAPLYWWAWPPEPAPLRQGCWSAARPGWPSSPSA